MTLHALLEASGLGKGRVEGLRDIAVTGVTADSRTASEGSVFVCVRGLRDDGARHIEEAVRRGARVVVSDRPLSVRGAAVIMVPDSRQAMSALAAGWFGYPSDGLRVIGVTGTNGKTTVTYLLEAVLRAGGARPGVIGTVQHRLGDKTWEAEHTTPEALELHGRLAAMRAHGATHVIMEVSSHALALHRVDHCEFDAAIFTNLTQDHLDFHLSLEGYADAKARLFSLLSGGPRQRKPPAAKYAVVNADDSWGMRMERAARTRVVRYGSQAGPEGVTAREVRCSLGGLECMVHHPGGPPEGMPLRIPLRGGAYNAGNVLAALAVGLEEGIPLPAIREGLSRVTVVPGRFEWVDEGQPFTVVVDYAHTPDALEKALHTAREFHPTRLAVIFGCGGDRDAGKRPVMGEIAARLADLVILTSDNPRGESPERIIRDIEAGAARIPQAVVRVCVDRERAIVQGVERAGPGDFVLIAGKGHERVQIVGNEVLPFDDREVVRRALRSLTCRR